jgi:hypothetical protein
MHHMANSLDSIKCPIVASNLWLQVQYHTKSITQCLLKQTPMSEWNWRAPFRRDSPFPLSGVDVVSVAAAYCICSIIIIFNWTANGVLPGGSVTTIIKYWKNLRKQQSIFLVLDFIVHFSHYIFRPHLAAIFMWFVNTKNISKAVTIYSTDPLSRYV